MHIYKLCISNARFAKITWQIWEIYYSHYSKFCIQIIIFSSFRIFTNHVAYTSLLRLETVHQRSSYSCGTQMIIIQHQGGPRGDLRRCTHVRAFDYNAGEESLNHTRKRVRWYPWMEQPEVAQLRMKERARCVRRTREIVVRGASFLAPGYTIASGLLVMKYSNTISATCIRGVPLHATNTRSYGCNARPRVSRDIWINSTSRKPAAGCATSLRVSSQIAEKINHRSRRDGNYSPVADGQIFHSSKSAGV